MGEYHKSAWGIKPKLLQGKDFEPHYRHEHQGSSPTDSEAIELKKQMKTITEKLAQFQIAGSKLNHSFLESFLESFSDGVIILSLDGELLHANNSIYKIIETYASLLTQTTLLNEEFAHLLRLIVDNPECYQQAPGFISSDVKLSRVSILRIRARQFQVGAYPSPLLWFSIEDQQASLSAQALVEAEKYKLSDREVEVWRLRKAHCTYLEIAGLLFISINTVKKHLSHITSKIELYECRHTYHVVNQA